MNRETTVKQIRNKENNLISNEKGIIEKWSQYFEELLFSQEGVVSEDKGDVYENKQQKEGEEDSIDKTDILKVLQTFKKRKAAGHDQATDEILNSMDRED